MGSWPAATTHAVHPHHMLVLLRYNRNYCDLCGGPLVGKLGYRCEPCDFDVHCTCLPSTGSSSAPPHNAHAHPPRPASYPWHAAAAAGDPGRPQLNLSLSQQSIGHPLGAQTPPPVHPAPSNHGWYHHRPPRPDYGALYRHSYDHRLQQQNYGALYRHSYDHHLQQQNYPTPNNQQVGYDVPDQQSFDYLQQNSPTADSLYDYTGTRDSGDGDDYDPLDDMGDDYLASWV